MRCARRRNVAEKDNIVNETRHPPHDVMRIELGELDFGRKEEE